MEIKYLGHSSFLIKTKDAKLVTDPFDSKMVGLKFSKQEADIVTVSHSHADHNQVQLIGGNPLAVNWPGQFEKKGIRVSGFRSFHDDKQGAERGENILYKIESEDISFLHCGDLGVIPDDAFIDLIGDVDILAIPVGGYYTISADQALAVIKKIEPAIVIPMHYYQGSIKELAPVTDFLKKMGLENITPLPKLTIKKEDLTDQEMKVVTFEIL